MRPQLLPPVELQVEQIKNTSFEVLWSPPMQNISFITGFVLTDNVTKLVYNVGRNKRLVYKI